MRIKHIALLAAFATVSLSSLAALAGAPQAVSTDVAEVRVAQPKKAWVDPMMVKRMQGVYALDNGGILRISEKHRKLYADVGDGPVEIVHIGHDRFEAVGKDMSLNFEGGPYPDAVFLRIANRQVASAHR